jgi:hypothetical protein
MTKKKARARNENTKTTDHRIGADLPDGRCADVMGTASTVKAAPVAPDIRSGAPPQEVKDYGSTGVQTASGLNTVAMASRRTDALVNSVC